MLAGSLRGVVAQNLLKKKGGGRVAAQEILFVTPGIAANIREGKTYQIPSQMQTGAKWGMQLLNDALEKLFKADTVEGSECYDRSIDKDDMAKRLKMLGYDVEQVAAAEVAAKSVEKAAAPKPAPAMASAAPRPAVGNPAAPGDPARPAPTWKRPGT
jgi:Tfp pilus assembly ATPase PilU